MFTKDKKSQHFCIECPTLDVISRTNNIKKKIIQETTILVSGVNIVLRLYIILFLAPCDLVSDANILFSDLNSGTSSFV